MNYMTIKNVDIADGVGCRVALYVSGCDIHCPGCHNAEAWAFDEGKCYTPETEKEILNLLSPDYISGLSILGGEPLADGNWQEVGKLCATVKDNLPGKTVWLYTGKLWEDCQDYPLIHFVDVLVDGPYIEAERDISLRFRGSRNQRIIDAQKSLAADDVILWDDPNHNPMGKPPHCWRNCL